MQQLIPADEAAARATAQRWFDHCRERSDPNSLFCGRSAWDPRTSSRVLIEWLKAGAMSSAVGMLHIVGEARNGWEEAHDAVCELTLDLMARGERLPVPLAAYSMEVINPHRLRSHRPRGPKLVRHMLQDISIAGGVDQVITHHGLLPTRSRRSPRPSACSVVAAVLVSAGVSRGTEHNVEKIWQRYSVQQFQPVNVRKI